MLSGAPSSSTKCNLTEKRWMLLIGIRLDGHSCDDDFVDAVTVHVYDFKTEIVPGKFLTGLGQAL